MCIEFFVSRFLGEDSNTQHCLHNHAHIHTHMGYEPIVRVHTHMAMQPAMYMNESTATTNSAIDGAAGVFFIPQPQHHLSCAVYVVE